MFITGYPPFYGDTDKEIYKAIVRKDPLTGNQATKQAEDPVPCTTPLLARSLYAHPDFIGSSRLARGAALAVDVAASVSRTQRAGLDASSHRAFASFP